MENFTQDTFFQFVQSENSTTNPSNPITGEDIDKFFFNDDFNLIPKIEDEDFTQQNENKEILNFTNPILDQSLIQEEKPADNKIAEQEQKLLLKSKRIQKREKAKERTQQKKQLKQEQTPAEIETEILNMDTMSTSSDSNLNSNKSSTAPLEGNKKMKQMIRNRISAQNSRDRKKLYVRSMESDAKNTKDENQRLKQQIEQLQNQYKKLQAENMSISNDKENWKSKAMNPKNITCNNCGNKEFTFFENMFNDPDQPAYSFAQRERLPFGQSSMFGLAVFTILGILMCFNGAQQTQFNDNNFLIQKQLEAIESIQNNGVNMKLATNKKEHQNLAKACELREDLLNDLYYQTKEELQATRDPFNNMSMYYNDENQPDNNQVAHYIDEEDWINNQVLEKMPGVQTVFCPKSFKYQNKENFELAETDLVQFIVPKNEMKLFVNQDDKIYKSNSSQLAEENSMYEILAKISSIRELKQ